MAGVASRILIAEDDPATALLLQEALTANGFTTTIARDGGDALERGDSNDFDLVLLDIGLPRRDGLEVLQELRARGRWLPVVLLTALSSVEATIAGLEAGADDYIPKPFELDEVMARIDARLRRDDRAAG
jgi:DNA-binding response OmpR family regulator